jgi:hypothetical protein
METSSITMHQAANNNPLVGITVSQEQVKKKYSSINSTVNIRSGSD